MSHLFLNGATNLMMQRRSRPLQCFSFCIEHHETGFDDKQNTSTCSILSFAAKHCIINNPVCFCEKCSQSYKVCFTIIVFSIPVFLSSPLFYAIIYFKLNKYSRVPFSTRIRLMNAVALTKIALTKHNNLCEKFIW